MMKRVIFLLAILILSACGKKDHAPPLPTVTVSNPVTAQVIPYLTETGNTVAYRSVNLVARVSGSLDAYSFTDGSMVKQGDLLFTIQPQPYADQVAIAQATLEGDIATLAYNELEYQRQQKMYQQKATSLANVEKWKATRDQAAAAVNSAKANLDNAQITYSYTHVMAPFDGRIGRHLVDPGNVVGNGETTKLATLDQISPMYVYFTVNELDVLRIRELVRQANFNPANIHQIPIEVKLQNETEFKHQGFLDFAATGLETSTGTIQLRGIIQNQDTTLLPGLFVQARIPLGPPTPQLTIPNTAIMSDQIGPYVFTLDKDNKVLQKRVTTGSTDAHGMIVISKGLQPDSRVIVQGIQNATPGATVSPTE